MNSTYTCKSGAELIMSRAPFSVGKKLFRTVINELIAVSLNIEGIDLKKINLANLDIPADTLKNAVLQLAGSELVEQCVHECIVRGPCVYAGIKITNVEMAFEPEQARGDYFGAALEVAMFNLRPFFPGLNFTSSTPKEAPNGAPR